MVLNLRHEFAYQERPVVPVRLSNGQASVSTEALLDTGADVSLFDAELAQALGVVLDATQRDAVLGIGGGVQEFAYSWLNVTIPSVRDDQSLTVNIAIGFVPGLGRTVGNLLGRNFFQHFDFGLHHHRLPTQRRLYLGRI